MILNITLAAQWISNTRIVNGFIFITTFNNISWLFPKISISQLLPLPNPIFLTHARLSLCYRCWSPLNHLHANLCFEVYFQWGWPRYVPTGIVAKRNIGPLSLLSDDGVVRQANSELAGGYCYMYYHFIA